MPDQKSSTTTTPSPKEIPTPTDEEWERLLEEEGLTEARQKAERKYQDLGQDEIKRLRERAKSDLYFLAYGILEYDLLSPDLHGHLCRWAEETRDEQFRLVLLPRGHYKSTVLTISESVQIALPNDAGLRTYPHILGPRVKILLAHETRESASRFLFEITEAFLRKPLMLALFPELVPEPRKQRINKWELDLQRDSHTKEPTFDTIGAGGAAQGRHYNHIKLDDIIGEDARESPTVMGRAIDWFDNINSLLTRLKFDGFDLIGTRWSASDVYSHAMEKYGVNPDVSIDTATKDERIEEGLLAMYARGAVENNQPIFSEEFSMEIFNVLRKNPKVWAAQYANNPRESGLTLLDPKWVKYYNVIREHALVVFEGDSRRIVPIHTLDRCVLVDPSVGETDESDETGIAVTGVDKEFNIYILETIKRRMKPPELIETIFRLYFKWYPRVFSIEEVIFSAVYRYWIMEKQKEMNVNLPIVPFKPGSKRKKHARIEGLSNYFASGQVYIQEGMHDLRDEIELYPLVGGSDHLLDALSQGPEVWGPGMDSSKIANYRKVEEKILQERSATTGY